MTDKVPVLKNNNLELASVNNYFFLNNKLVKLSIAYKDQDSLTYFYAEDLANLDINIDLETSNQHELNLYLYNPKKLNISINAKKYEAKLILNLLVITNNKQSDIKINAINKEDKTELVVKAMALGFNKADIKIECIGEIEKNKKGTINKQSLKGYNYNDSHITLLPILKINEFDVKANHAALIGFPNSEDIFYLMSRGISFKDANQLIEKGLIAPWLDKVKNEEFRKAVDKVLDKVYE